MEKLTKEYLKRHAIYFVVAISSLLLMMIASISFAWFSRKPLSPVGGEVMLGYFAGGEGTEANPYVINRPIHLYNLAWLQNTGRFNETDENGNYTQYHFVLADDLDMTGLALPPIGTTTFPFIGTFESLDDPTTDERERYTILNLTVSGAIGTGEIEKRPQAVTEITGAEIIGTFGVIGSYTGEATFGSIVPSVSDFYLEAPVIRAQTEEALMGLIAGYVNGKMHNVGVLGGTLVSGVTNTDELGDNTSLSYYSLIGNKAKDVNWDGVYAPGETPGAIKVDVNDAQFKSEIENFENTSSIKYIPVPESTIDRAFIVGRDVETNSQNINGKKFYTTLVKSGDEVYVNRNDPVSINSNNFKDGYLTSLGEGFTENADFYTRFEEMGGTTLDTGLIDFDNTTLITRSDGSEIEVPTNCVWFNPAAGGNCIISFMLTKSSGDGHKSIYKIQRDDDGDIIDIQETKLVINAKVGNKTVICFQFKITDAEAKSCDFAIGSSSDNNDTSVLFYFLALAGANSTESEITNTSKELLQVNFVSEDARDANTGVILPNYIVTTFDIRLLTSNAAEERISFSRSSMTVDAEAGTPVGQLSATRYSHKYTAAEDEESS